MYNAKVWETVMGLEVHVELATKTKIFCSCTTEFGGAPNTHCCPICTGMPGVLPKAYQISQLYLPICRNGGIEIEAEDGGRKVIGIHEIHMEEDAGKLVHDPSTNSTMVDYNRCGVPLIEIVSEPDFRSANEVIRYLEKLKAILQYIGVSDCKMQEGSLRADVNLSVRPAGSAAFGTRTEMKNMNSFKAIVRAIHYESSRQIGVLEHGGEVMQETRR